MPYNWGVVGIEVPYGLRGPEVKVFCPFCHDGRKPEHQREREMSVNLENGYYYCHNCGVKGKVPSTDSMFSLGSYEKFPEQKEYNKPLPLPAPGYSDSLLMYFKKRGIDKATLEKAGVREGVTYMPSFGGNMNTVQFAYYLNGEHVNTKYRSGDKRFKNTTGAQAVPYNIDSIRGAKDCIITEGEIDALSFIQIGCEHVISVPNGAKEQPSRYIAPYYNEFFKDKETIYLAPDTDAPGQELKEKLLNVFGPGRCTVIEYEEGCKDANDVLCKYGPDCLKECVRAAHNNIRGGFSLFDFKAQLDSLLLNGLKPGAGIGVEVFDRLITFETKRLCVVTGIPGSGKSEFIDEMCVRFNLIHKWRVAYFSPENLPLEYHCAKLMSKIIGKAFTSKKILKEEYEEAAQHVDRNFFFIEPDTDCKIETILSIARKFVEIKGVKCLVLDPYNRIEYDETNEPETSRVSKLLDKLTTFAVRNNVLVILMAHPAKLPKNKLGGYDAPTLYDISGSAHFFNKADFGMVVHRNRKLNLTEVHIQKVKFRHLGHNGVCYFKYNEENGRYTPTTEITARSRSVPDNMKATVKIEENGEKRDALVTWTFNNENFLHNYEALGYLAKNAKDKIETMNFNNQDNTKTEEEECPF